jgi:hypothetical protein
VLVGVLEPAGDLARDPDRLGRCELSLAAQALAQRLAFDPGHREPQDRRFRRAGGGDLAGVVHRHDVGVLEAGGQHDLAQEALGT